MGKNINNNMKSQRNQNDIVVGSDKKRPNKFAILSINSDSDNDSSEEEIIYKKPTENILSAHKTHHMKQNNANATMVHNNNHEVELKVAPAPVSVSMVSMVSIASKIQPIVNNTNPDQVANDGRYILLPSLWSLWEHRSDSKNWKIDSYKKIIELNNVSQFWKMLNNFYRLDHKVFDFFLMKENIQPIWEHPKNRDGSICSIRTDISNGIDALNLITLHMITNKLYTEGIDDINGISCSVRNNWMVIKIWCGFKEDKLTAILREGILGKIVNLTLKHILTAPEY